MTSKLQRFLYVFTVCASALPAGQIVYEKNLSANNIAVDYSGNAYVWASGAVTKLSPDGVVLYSKSVALAGTWYGIAVDGVGNVLIVGSTDKDNLPTTPGVIQPTRNASGICRSADKEAKLVPCSDAFVAKLDVNGNLAWATYLGGSLPEQANAVAVDAAGNLFVIGLTQSADFPILGGFQRIYGGATDGFITKISPDGSKILYSSFIGGTGHDVAQAIALDAAGAAYVVGTGAEGLPTTAGSFGPSCNSAGSAFVLKIAPFGDRLLFGGCLDSSMRASEATAVAVDATNNIYVGGDTGSKDFPKTPGALDGRANQNTSNFLTKISADGVTLLYSALLDGASPGIHSLGLDSAGSLYAVGSTGSAAMPVIGPAMQPCTGSDSTLDFKFLLKLNPVGSALTYFSYEDPGQSKLSIATTADGTLYEAAGVVRKITNLETPGNPYLSKFCVLNGASFRSHVESRQPGISPGEMVTLKGTGLGPASSASAALVNGGVGTSLGQTQIFFDGLAAPLVYAQDRQINVVAPYNLIGKTQTTIQVRSQSGVTQSVTIPVSPVSVAVFLNSATGAPLVFNQDFSLNSAINPAIRGAVIVLFVTGAGQTAPPSADGQVWQGTGALQASVSAELKSLNAPAVASPVLYAGPAPGMISAVQQMNLVIPMDLPGAGSYFLNVMVGSQQFVVPVFVR